MKNRNFKILSLLCSIVIVNIIHAQSLDLNNQVKIAVLINDDFNEGFKKNINVSSGVIMGMIMGQVAGLQSISKIIMDKSGWQQATTFCLRTSSNDGLFWAENPYQVDEGSLWKIEPVSKKFNKQLKEYGHKKIIAKVALSQVSDKLACEKNDVIYAPIISSENNTNHKIKIYINSSNRSMVAELWKDKVEGGDEKLLELKCNNAKVEGASIYDQICSFQLDEINYFGIAQLRMYFDAGPFGSEQWTEKIALPKH